MSSPTSMALRRRTAAMYAMGTFQLPSASLLSLSKLMTWDCNGGVVTSVTDENSKNTTYAYVNSTHWPCRSFLPSSLDHRPATQRDQLHIQPYDRRERDELQRDHIDDRPVGHRGWLWPSALNTNKTESGLFVLRHGPIRLRLRFSVVHGQHSLLSPGRSRLHDLCYHNDLRWRQSSPTCRSTMAVVDIQATTMLPAVPVTK